MLKTDPDTLLLAAAEGRIRLYWLLNRVVLAERLDSDTSKDSSPVEPIHRYFMYVPLGDNEAAELLRSEKATGAATFLTDANDPEGCWIAPAFELVEGGRLTEDDVSVTRQMVFVKRSDVDDILNKGVSPSPGTIKSLSSPPDQSHRSMKLSIMLQAAIRFWANADRNDRGTHPDNATVAEWLTKHGFSQTLADKAATIIRPEWAPSGRKPEE